MQITNPFKNMTIRKINKNPIINSQCFTVFVLIDQRRRHQFVIRNCSVLSNDTTTFSQRAIVHQNCGCMSQYIVPTYLTKSQTTFFPYNRPWII